jgi:predicted ATP-grasp superfamily ATP-dependent carboligase
LSAKRLGFEVFVVDYFGDVDLKRSVDSLRSVKGEYDSKKILEAAKEVAEAVKPDGILLTSELGCNPAYVSELEAYNVLGNNAAAVSGVREWESFFRRLDELQILHPKTFLVSDMADAKNAVEDIGFPLVVKPTHGSAGFGVELASSLDGVLDGLRAHGVILVQEYVEGVDASVSSLGTGDKAKAISLNKQFLGLHFLGCSRRFQYCGNLVPYESKHREECFRIAKVIGEKFGLSGSFGIDFVIADKPYVIEVNPRFQDTLECVERVYDVNLVDLHLKALKGELPSLGAPKTVCAKGIRYAMKTTVVSGDLTRVRDCVDIYATGTRVLPDEPVCSAFAQGLTEEGAFLSLQNKLSEIQGYLTEV